MTVRVDRVSVPAMSSVGFGWGEDVKTGKRVRFAGDHRPMRDLGEAVAAGEMPEVEVEGWQLLG